MASRTDIQHVYPPMPAERFLAALDAYHVMQSMQQYSGAAGSLGFEQHIERSDWQKLVVIALEAISARRSVKPRRLPCHSTWDSFLCCRAQSDYLQSMLTLEIGTMQAKVAHLLQIWYESPAGVAKLQRPEMSQSSCPSLGDC